MSARPTTTATAHLLWEVPLAVVSFVTNRATRVCLRSVVRLYLLLRPRPPLRWRVTSADTIAEPLVLPMILSEGGRWNVHAITASLGMVRPEKSVSLHVPALAASGHPWTVVLYTFPGYRTVASFGPEDVPDGEEWLHISVPPRRYSLILRYYHWPQEVRLPEVRVDGVSRVPGSAVDPDVNDFHHSLPARSNAFYWLLNYYLYVLLKLRHRFPSRFVEREFFPVGNPRTSFRYGFLERGDALSMEIAAALLEDHDVFLTVYSRASLPLFWYRVESQAHVTEAVAQPCYYLIRIHRKPRTSASFRGEWIRLARRRPEHGGHRP